MTLLAFYIEGEKCENHGDDKQALSVALVIRTALIGNFSSMGFSPSVMI